MSIIIILLTLIGVATILRSISRSLSLKGRTTMIVNVLVLGIATLLLLYFFGYIQFSGETKILLD